MKGFLQPWVWRGHTVQAWVMLAVTVGFAFVFGVMGEGTPWWSIGLTTLAYGWVAVGMYRIWTTDREFIEAIRALRNIVDRYEP